VIYAIIAQLTGGRIVLPDDSVFNDTNIIIAPSAEVEEDMVSWINQENNSIASQQFQMDELYSMKFYVNRPHVEPCVGIQLNAEGYNNDWDVTFIEAVFDVTADPQRFKTLLNKAQQVIIATGQNNWGILEPNIKQVPVHYISEVPHIYSNMLPGPFIVKPSDPSTVSALCAKLRSVSNALAYNM
jgi:hypothetical protein